MKSKCRKFLDMSALARRRVPNFLLVEIGKIILGYAVLNVGSSWYRVFNFLLKNSLTKILEYVGSGKAQGAQLLT